jgi:predicted 3-demethylubiquinone-9 3-methyltransferase (glyoxalase superfamily)
MSNSMQKIIPFLWFDDQAEEAANFYASLFKDSKIENINRYSEGPMQGKVLTIVFQLEGQRFMALDGGPHYQFTPAVSFFVNCASKEELDGLFSQLSEGGSVLMPLQAYPFSERFAWITDKYGVSWQLNYGKRSQKITPFLMFVGKLAGNVDKAINLYTSLFEKSNIVNIERFTADEEPSGTVKRAIFNLYGQEFMAIDSHFDHAFTFSGAISFFVNCEGQDEVDFLWDTLTQDGEELMCGWLEDRFGVTWQIIPTALMEMLTAPDPEKAKRATEAMLKMRKIDIAVIKQAFENQLS